VTAIPKKDLAAVLERDGYACVIDGPDCLGEATEPDHRANRGSGGSVVLNDIRVLIAACGICNGWKTTVHGAARERLIERGVIVEKASTNAGTLTRCALTPVTYPDGLSFWLTRDGRRVSDPVPPF
jgi:hypothetical protein